MTAIEQLCAIMMSGHLHCCRSARRRGPRTVDFRGAEARAAGRECRDFLRQNAAKRCESTQTLAMIAFVGVARFCFQNRSNASAPWLRAERAGSADATKYGSHTFQGTLMAQSNDLVGLTRH